MLVALNDARPKNQPGAIVESGTCHKDGVLGISWQRNKIKRAQCNAALWQSSNLDHRSKIKCGHLWRLIFGPPKREVDSNLIDLVRT